MHEPVEPVEEAMMSSTKQRKHGSHQHQEEQNSTSTHNEIPSNIDNAQTETNKYHHSIRINTMNILSSRKLKLLILPITIIFWFIKSNVMDSHVEYHQHNQSEIKKDIYKSTSTYKTKKYEKGIGFNEKLYDPSEAQLCKMISLSSIHDCITYYALIDLADYITVEEAAQSQYYLGKKKKADKKNQTRINDDIVTHEVNVGMFSDYGILTRRGYKGGPVWDQVNQDRAFYMISSKC